jgi:hypothetical protein
MKTKAFYSFEQKLSYFDDDIELIDVLRAGVLNGDLTDPNSNKLLRHIDPDRHKHIARRRNSEGSRRNTINHLRSSIYSSYVKDVYEEVTEYLKQILEQASKNGFNSGRIIGEHSFKMDAKSVLELGDWDSVCRKVSESVFQNLESEKSTLNLLSKMASKLALDIDQQIIDSALPYLEVRHFLVHTNGKLSQEYIAKYPHIPRNNGMVILDYRLISNTRDSVKALISAYDQEVVDKNLLAPEDLRA